MDFSKTLIAWYLQNKRDLPWRKTVNPYKIWLSEIMLQQTRVAQGLPYFIAFTEAFPTVNDLADASEEQVLKLWQGLGYYSRARNLHITAKYIAFNLNGKFPDNYNDLLKLKGVGEYTAAAIASIAYNQPVAVVDGNVFRVLSRFFNITLDISLNTTKKEFTKLANALLLKDNASLFNQGLMEFGALQCTPKNPDCNVCVFNSACLALKYKKVASLPVKLKKTKVTDRFFNYLIIKDKHEKIIVNKRTGKGIWLNLSEFPLIETVSAISENEIIELIKKQLDFIPETITLQNSEAIKHKLSHQHLHIHFWEITASMALKEALDPENIKLLPFPIVIHNFLESYWNK